MTDEQILDTAFRVWGEDFYRTTSLSPVAEALGVTKPALFRHFRTKKLLLSAMRKTFFDRMAAHVKNELQKPGALPNSPDEKIRIARSFASYFIRRRDDFIFWIGLMYGTSEQTDALIAEFEDRGLSLKRPGRAVLGGGGELPQEFLYISATIFFMVVHFHKVCRKRPDAEGAESAALILEAVDSKIRHGIMPDGRLSGADFSRLEALVEGTPLPPEQDDAKAKLLRIVAEAVAETSPWQVTMDMVAKKAGCTKSSLYSHFENKADMIGSYILTEAGYIALYSRECSCLAEDAAARLYLAIVAIAHYLRLKPAVLHCIDKLRLQKPEFEKSKKAGKGNAYSPVYDIFSRVTNTDGERLISQKDTEWILFLIVNSLLYRKNKYAQDKGGESLRALFSYIAGGIKK